MSEPDLPLTARDTAEWIRKAAGKVNRLGRGAPTSYRSISASQTLLDRDEVVEVTATCTVTLPTMVEGKRFTIKRSYSGASNVTVSGGSKNIDGAASVTLTTQYASITVVGGASQWLKIASV